MTMFLLDGPLVKNLYNEMLCDIGKIAQLRDETDNRGLLQKQLIPESNNEQYNPNDAVGTVEKGIPQEQKTP